MTSILSTGTKRRNSPAWCKEGMFTGRDPTPSGIPATLNAVVRLHRFDSGYEISFNETIHLTRNQSNNGWTGQVAYTDYLVVLEVLDRPSSTTVSLRCRTWYQGHLIDDAAWPSVVTDFRPPWGTAIETVTNPPDDWFTQLQVLG